MATKRTADVDTPINFMQEMVTALSGRTRPGVFRPFEREGLVGLIQTGEFQMARMAQITASLSDPDVRRAMLEILWARQAGLSYRVAPALGLGYTLEKLLLDEAQRRRMLVVLPMPDGLHSSGECYYQPLASEAQKAWGKRKVPEDIASLNPAFFDTLPSLEWFEVFLFLHGHLLAEEEMALLPAADQALLRCPLSESLRAKLEAGGQGREAAGSAARTVDVLEPGPEIEAKAEGSRIGKCPTFDARCRCAQYRWLQEQGKGQEMPEGGQPPDIC